MPTTDAPAATATAPLALSPSNTGYLCLGPSRSRASALDGHKKPKEVLIFWTDESTGIVEHLLVSWNRFCTG